MKYRYYKLKSFDSNIHRDYVRNRIRVREYYDDIVQEWREVWYFIPHTDTIELTEAEAMLELL